MRAQRAARCPPESWAGRRCANSPSRTISSASATRRLASAGIFHLPHHEPIGDVVAELMRGRARNPGKRCSRRARTGDTGDVAAVEQDPTRRSAARSRRSCAASSSCPSLTGRACWRKNSPRADREVDAGDRLDIGVGLPQVLERDRCGRGDRPRRSAAVIEKLGCRFNGHVSLSHDGQAGSHPATAAPRRSAARSHAADSPLPVSSQYLQVPPRRRQEPRDPAEMGLRPRPNRARHCRLAARGTRNPRQPGRCRETSARALPPAGGLASRRAAASGSRRRRSGLSALVVHSSRSPPPGTDGFLIGLAASLTGKESSSYRAGDRRDGLAGSPASAR